MWRSVDLCGWICPHLEMISDTAKFGHNTESVKHRFSLYILGLRRAFIVDYGAVVYFGILSYYIIRCSCIVIVSVVRVLWYRNMRS